MGIINGDVGVSQMFAGYACGSDGDAIDLGDLRLFSETGPETSLICDAVGVMLMVQRFDKGLRRLCRDSTQLQDLDTCTDTLAFIQ